MTDTIDPERAQEVAQAVVEVVHTAEVEYGYDPKFETARESARVLYQDYGPFEIEWPEDQTEPVWYDEGADS